MNIKTQNNMVNNVLQKPNGEILIYQAEDGTTKISVRFENENVWHSLVPPLLNRAGTFMKEMNYSRFQLVRFFYKFNFMHDYKWWRYRMES